MPADKAGPTWVFRQVMESIDKNKTSGSAEKYGVVLLSVVVLAGVVLRLLGDRVSVDHLVHSTPEEKEVAEEFTAWNPELSAKQLTIVGALGIAALAVVGLFVFYPPVDSLIEEMNVVRVEAYDAAREENMTELIRRIVQWKRQAEKLPTSAMIRRADVVDTSRENLKELMYALELVEDQIAEGRTDEIKMMRAFVERHYRNCVADYRGEK